MLQIRTIDAAYRKILEVDPQSSITKNALRALMVSGRIHSVKIGTKYLVNLEEVMRYFRNEPPHEGKAEM